MLKRLLKNFNRIYPNGSECYKKLVEETQRLTDEGFEGEEISERLSEESLQYADAFVAYMLDVLTEGELEKLQAELDT